MDVVSSLFVIDGGISFLRVAIVLVAIYFLIKKLLNRQKYVSYPPFAKGLYVPWFGHMFAFGTGPAEFFADQYRKLGDIFSFVLFGTDCVFLGGPEAQKAFFNAPEEVLCAREAYKFTIPCFGPGVCYDAPDARFQQQRKMAASALTMQMFKKYVPKIEQETEDYLNQKWGDKGEVDFQHAIGEITILTSTSCLQGPEIRAQVDEKYAGYMEALDKALSAIGFFYPGLPLPAYRNRDIARRKMGSMFKAVMKNRRKEGFKGDDVLQVFMESKYDNGDPLTDDEIAALLVALMLAGQHTSNITSSWSLLFILTHTDIYNRVMEEQKKVVGTDDHLDYDKVKNMNLLGYCVKETLRLRPPIQVIFRKVVQDFQYGDYVVPTGSLVCVSPGVYSGLEESQYKNPKAFDPDRFDEERQEDKKETHTYFPFSLGRHSCIGEKFAYLQVKTILSVLFRRYDCELVGTLADYPTDQTSLLASPKGPIRLKYKKRQ